MIREGRVVKLLRFMVFFNFLDWRLRVDSLIFVKLVKRYNNKLVLRDVIFFGE